MDEAAARKEIIVAAPTDALTAEIDLAKKIIPKATYDKIKNDIIATRKWRPQRFRRFLRCAIGLRGRVAAEAGR